MTLEPMPIQIEYGPNKVEGQILKINPTGVLVELSAIPYQMGSTVKVTFTLNGVGQFSAEARPIKSYDNFRRKVKVETGDGTVVQDKVMKLSELHFIRPSEELRSGIMRHLMDLQVNLMKKG